MPISFTDIVRLAPQIKEDETLSVGKGGKLSIEDKLDADFEGTAISEEEFFAALERQTSKAFADGVRGKLAENTPLTGRVIRQVVAASKTEIQTEAHVRNLTSGLVAKTTISSDAAPFDRLLAELAENAAVKALSKDPAHNGAWLDYDVAAAQMTLARAALKNDKTPARVAALAEAEGSVAAALHAIGETVRLNVPNLPEDLVFRLMCLDEYATELELGAMRAGDVASVLPSGATTAAIEVFKTEARDFLAAVAALDTAHPTTRKSAADFLSRLQTGYAKAMAGLDVLKKAPGLDPRALRELEANLAEMKARIDRTSGSLQEEMKARALDEILAMVRNSVDGALAEEKLYADQADRGRPVTELLMDLTNIAIDLEKATKGKTSAELLAALADPKSALTAVLARVSSLKLNVDYVRHLKFVGLGDFDQRLGRLRALMGDERYASPIGKLDVRLLGEVMRGEIDLVNYFDLKRTDLPEEVFLANLDGEKAHKTGTAGTGNFNSVSFYEIPDVRTGLVEKYVVKNIELSQDSGAERSVAARFSTSQHARNTAKINYASWKAANLIGCGSSVTRSGVVRIDGRYQLVQEVADGQDAEKCRELYKQEFGKADPKVQRRIWRELHIAAAKLEWADWLSGQLDRTIHNELIDIQVEERKDQPPHVTVTLKGIDNDSAFPERRTGLRTFTDQRGREMLTSKDFPTGKNATNPRETRLLQRKLDGVIYKNGVRGLRQPQFIPASVRERLVNLKPEQYAAELKPYLSEEALAAAVARYIEMRNYALSLPPDRVIYDQVSTDSMNDGEIDSEIRRLEAHYGPHYMVLKEQVSTAYISSVGGFYGYVLGL